MSQTHQCRPDDFPEFNFSQMERYAKKWVNKYSVIQIERIILFRYNSKYEERWRAKHNGKWAITRYALVFEYSGCKNTDLSSLNSFPNRDDDECTTALKEIIYANKLEHRPEVWLFDEAFENTVYKPGYKPKPDINFFSEWKCIPKPPNKVLKQEILEDEGYWILYCSKTPVNAEEDFDAYVKKMEVTFERDDSIKFKEPGKPATTLNYSAQWSKIHITKNKLWNTFIKIIEKRPPHYYIGKAHEFPSPISKKMNSKASKDERIRNSEYDKKLGHLKQINEKLTTFFNSSEYLRDVPKGYKFYKLCEGEKDGLYCFKFKCGQKVDVSKHEKLSNDELLKKIAELQDILVYTPENSSVRNDLSDALMTALGRKLMNEKKVKKILNKIREWLLEKTASVK